MTACVCDQVQYKKQYEQTKAHYHMTVDTAEQLHHKENAVLHSQVRQPLPRILRSSRLPHCFKANPLLFQVKYREEYEKSKGRTQMEFGDSLMYKASKEAQKMQSEVKAEM